MPSIAGLARVTAVAPLSLLAVSKGSFYISNEEMESCAPGHQLASNGVTTNSSSRECFMRTFKALMCLTKWWFWVGCKWITLFSNQLVTAFRILLSSPNTQSLQIKIIINLMQGAGLKTDATVEAHTFFYRITFWILSWLSFVPWSCFVELLRSIQSNYV